MSEPLSQQELNSALSSLEGWSVSEGKLTRTFTFSDFREAAAFIVRLAFEAESLQHHPELYNVYNTVRISLSTHDAGDQITGKDIELAQAIDSISK
jgi:4a-hydroxytetrahydrobiopterin dehydratase